VSKNSGFTLLEILVAITLASLLLTCIYGVFSTTSSAKEKVEKQGAALHLGRVVIARLDRELLGLAMNNQNKIPALKGGENSLGEPYIELLTTSTGGPRDGMRQVHYRLGPDPDNRMTLWRSEKGLNQTETIVEERLAQGLDKLKFSFFDGQNWRDNWDSMNGGHPVLVSAELTLQGTNNKTPLLSVFDLP